ncbi:hypothetical protein HDU96_007671 [Phlyctochytrium bullatum]|nr:hypothetical protein HDU96_007671 [Phlyctochytrium bullatum]
MTAKRIQEAADAIRAAGSPVPSNVMRSLETAIELREEVTKKYEADEGHSFFLRMLKDVRKKLFPLTKMDEAKKGRGEGKGNRKKQQVENESKKNAAPVNYFSVQL